MQEIEIKLAATPEGLATLLEDPGLGGPAEEHRFTTTYYDTVDWRLRRAGMALRVRSDGDSREQTLKRSLGDGAGPITRAEWSAPLTDEFPVLHAFPAEARHAVAPLLGRRRLWAYAQLVTDRTIRTALFRDSLIELAFDRVRIGSGDAVVLHHELELELLQGSRADLLHFALELPFACGLSWSITAKSERACRLAGGKAAGAAKAGPVALERTMDVTQAFRAIAWNCLTQFLRNYPLIIETRDSEALHQGRVALRRLRAAFAIFSDLLTGSLAERLRQEIAAATKILGTGRDLDVLIAGLAGVPGTDHPDPEAASELIAELARQRERAYAHIIEMLRSAPFQRLLFETALWIEELAETEAPILPFVARTLRKRRQRIVDRLERLRTLTPRQRHRLRIAVKKLRYAAEFVEGLYPGEDRKRFADTLGQLQDRLGDLNDLADARSRALIDFPELGDTDRARLSRTLDHLVQARADQEDTLLDAAVAAGKDVLAVPRFWKKD